ncbi:hypothetical protein EZS27_014978 [termite gut metagenome]|uniref:Uncharacterized protein n=1 Tax=termite gut metagenome TaxID=433724 RepID=A0A5J4RSB3_9ZZZZ
METSKKQSKMNIFLKLKHWQLFGLLIGIPVIFQFVVMGTVITNSDLMKLLLSFLINPTRLADIILIIPTKMIATYSIVMILFIGLIFCWFYSLGTNLYKKLPKTTVMHLTKFKIFFIISVVCKLFTSVYMYFIFSEISVEGELNLKMFTIIASLYLFSIFCTLYCFYFIAKVLKIIEHQKDVVFNDYALEFFGVWIFPIGVWFIQPMVNKVFDYSLSDDNNLTHADII